MNNKNISKLNWRRAFSSLAIVFGTVGYLDNPAIATPIKDNFQLVQVGVRSGITSPTPLNLRPRTHTPLPRSNYSHYPSSNYSRRNNSYGSYRKNDHHHHGDYHHSHHRNTNHGRRKNRGRIIIISPGNHSSYSNYTNYSNSGSYIRVIGN